MEQGQGGAAGLAFLLSMGAVRSANIKQQVAGQQMFKEDSKRNSQVLWSVFERSSDISINKTILTLQCTFPIIILPQNGLSTQELRLAVNTCYLCPDMAGRRETASTLTKNTRSQHCKSWQVEGEHTSAFTPIPGYLLPEEKRYLKQGTRE